MQGVLFLVEDKTRDVTLRKELIGRMPQKISFLPCSRTNCAIRSRLSSRWWANWRHVHPTIRLRRAARWKSSVEMWNWKRV